MEIIEIDSGWWGVKADKGMDIINSKIKELELEYTVRVINVVREVDRDSSNEFKYLAYLELQEIPTKKYIDKKYIGKKSEVLFEDGI